MARPERFDAAYYDRFYRDPKTRVSDAAEIRVLGRLVAAYCRHVDQPVRRVLDIGCGLGHWRAVVQREFRRAEYVGVEHSPYLCRELGWQRGSVVDWRADAPFDLVVCQGVLQYLRAADARRAIRNLGRLCAGVLFLEVLTEEDWAENCDRAVTDGDVFLRPADWYRELLARDFVNGGSGLFVHRRAGVALYELEKLS